MQTRLVRIVFCAVLAALIVCAAASPARAQGFISPFIGYDFSGDSGCPDLRGCEDKKLNAGVSVGSLGSILGFELEFGYAKNFFGEAPGFSSSVLTVMANMMLGPRIGPVQPYAVGGVGLIRSHLEFTPSPALATDNKHAGWDLGGGVIVMAGQRVGVRGDIRHVHAFEDLELLGLFFGDAKLDFGRASAALVLKF